MVKRREEYALPAAWREALAGCFPSAPLDAVVLRPSIPWYVRLARPDAAGYKPPLRPTRICLRRELLESPRLLLLVVHELVHLEQVQRGGLPRFLFGYLWQTWRHGYWENRYERHARARAGRILRRLRRQGMAQQLMRQPPAPSR